MVDIYNLSLIGQIPEIRNYAQMFAFSAVSSTVELIISCFVCGLVHQKSDEIYAVLDKWGSNSLSDSEYKEWLMFKSITRNTPFGFTIGGFASLRKTTLISVRIIN